MMHDRMKKRRETVQRERWDELHLNVLEALRSLNEFDDKSRTPAWVNLASALLKMMGEIGDDFSEQRLFNVMKMVNELPPTLTALVDELPAKLAEIIDAAETSRTKHLAFENRLPDKDRGIGR